MSSSQHVLEGEGNTSISNNSLIISSILTHRGTLLEFINHPDFGYTCRMDGLIQSATADERMYHEHIANLAAKHLCNPTRVLIVGSGEGCLARECLKWPSVEKIVMVEWDNDVLEAFSNTWVDYWAGKHTWSDYRLTIERADIWELINIVRKDEVQPFDCILVDLFDPKEDSNELAKWKELIVGLRNWLTPSGCIVAYCGMDDNNVTEETMIYLTDGGMWREIAIKGNESQFTNVYKNTLTIPSFGGDAVFVVASSANT